MCKVNKFLIAAGHLCFPTADDDVEYKTRLDCSIVEVLVVDGPLKTILSWVREFSEGLVAWSAAAGGGGGGIVLDKSCGWEFN